jgi:GAF domain-containing protein/transcriptional regulator with XRE-family HTH domain
METELLAGLGPRIRELRRARGLKQHQLASACEISPSYIGLMETGRRGIERSLLERICKALALPPSAVDQLLHQRGEIYTSHTKPDTRVNAILEDARQTLRALSCTFYVRDPFWPAEWRLIAMPGVQVPEPMHGFVCPEGTRSVLEMGDCEFCPDTLATTVRRDLHIKLPGTIPAGHRRLFSDFVEREGVGASARLLIRDGGSIEAVLFVNFSEPTGFSIDLRRKLEALRDTLAGEVPAITRMLRIDDAPTLQQTIALLQPIQDWIAKIGIQNQTLTQYLESVLGDVMAVLKMDGREGFGTIHLYRSDRSDLALAAYRGAIDKIDLAKVQSVVRGEGTISWVALRQRAIVIGDLKTSPFRAIYRSLRDRDDILSALAVPMMVGDTLMGVLNLESELPNRFESRHVRALWYAAGSAGVAARLYREASNSRKLANMQAELLHWFCLAVATKEWQEKALTALAETACCSLDAQQCDLWMFDPTQSPAFCPLGASQSFKIDRGPREKGWSEYVCRSRCAVWISDIRTSGSLDVSFWNSRMKAWERTAPRPGTPESANPQVLKMEFLSELGIPIVYEQECVGVAWLKFNTFDHVRPGQAEMLLAEGFAESAGRVFKSLPPQQQEGFVSSD